MLSFQIFVDAIEMVNTYTENATSPYVRIRSGDDPWTELRQVLTNLSDVLYYKHVRFVDVPPEGKLLQVKKMGAFAFNLFHITF